MKKVGKYLIITLLLLLGLCCVGVLYLFFIPNSSLFNITYINNNSTIKSSYYDHTGISEIELNSRSYDIEIVEAKNERIYCEVYSNSFGFVLTKNETASVSASLSNNTLTFNVKEPYGFATKNSSYIKLYVPASISFDLTLNNKSATTSINSSNIKVNNLEYSTEKGKFNFTNGTILGSLNLNLNKSIFTISKDVATNANNVKLKVTTGKFLAENSVLGNISIEQNSRGVINVFECNRLDESITSAGGQITITNISQINVSSSDTNITLGSVASGANIQLTGTGSVKISNINAVSYVTTNSGSVEISNSESNLTLQSDTGNIIVRSAKTTISTKSNYGNIEVYFNENADSYMNNSNARVLYAEIKNGTLTAAGVEHLGSVSSSAETGIVVTGNGRVNIRMNNVYGVNSIDGNNGNVNVVVNKDSAYVLTTISTLGNVRVNLTQTTQYNGYTKKDYETTYVNCSSSSNSLLVSTNQGDLTILDTNFA